MGLTNLRKFSTTVIKDKSTSDQAQVPAEVVIEVYGRGATVSVSNSVPPSGGTATVSVYDTGELTTSSTCQVGTDSASNLTVTAVNSSTSISVRNDGANTVTLTQFARLLKTSDRPRLYLDTTGATLLSFAGSTTTDGRGYVEFYTQHQFFDFIAVDGSNKVLYTDQESGAPLSKLVNVTDFLTFQEAIDTITAQPGGILYVPTGTYTTTTVPSLTGGLRFSGYAAGMVGDGIANTYLIFDEKDNDFIKFGTGQEQIRIENIRMEGAGVSGTGRGIVLDRNSGCIFNNLWLDLFPNWEIDFNDSTGDCVHNIFTKVRCTRPQSGGCLRLGVSVQRAFSTLFTGCAFTSDTAGTVPADITWSQNTVFNNCDFESTIDLNMVYSNGFTILPAFNNCWFETGGSITVPTNFMVLAKAGTNPAWSFRHCMFVRGGTLARLIKSEGSSTSWLIDGFHCFLAGGQSSGTDDLVFGAGDSCTLIGGRMLDTANTHASDPQVSASDYAFINRLGAGRRIHVPHVTSTQRDQTTFAADVFPFNPQKGDIIYNATTSTYQLFHGIAGSPNTYDWRGVSVLRATGNGPPASGTWALGDMAYFDGDSKLYICTTAGVAGAGAVFKSAVFA